MTRQGGVYRRDVAKNERREDLGFGELTPMFASASKLALA